MGHIGVLLEDFAGQYDLVAAMDGVASVQPDVSADMDPPDVVGICHCGPVGNAIQMFFRIQQVIRAVQESDIFKRRDLDRHVIPAPDILRALQKGVGDTVPVEDVYESTVRPRASLRQLGREIHSVAKRIRYHM